MEANSFGILFEWIVQHGYALMFLAMFLEGPVVSAVSAFASSLGYFSFPLVFFLSIFGDVLGDVVFYSIGYFGRSAAVNWSEKRFHVPHSRIEKISRLLKKHQIKAIIALKIMPFVVLPGFIVVGMSRVKFLKFFSLCLGITLIRNSIFLGLGYYAGEFFKNNDGSWEQVERSLIALSVIIVVVFLLYRRVSSFLVKRFEDWGL